MCRRPQSIIEAIDRCRVMVLVLTPSANNSDQVAREVAIAAKRRIPIIPFRVEAVVPFRDLRFYLSTIHWLDAFPPPPTHHFPLLVGTIRDILSSRAGDAAGPGPT